ncbi:MAG: hypothetical protein ACOCX4_10010, partial [Planctomycetota bacterium]
RGDFEGAAALDGQGGAVREWLVAGPFGRRLHSNFYTIFEPEAGPPSLDAPMEGSRGPVTWSRLLPWPFQQVLRPYRAIHPDDGAAVYLFTQIRCTEPRSVLLHIDCPVSWRAWVNGAASGEADRLAAYSPREQAAPVVLRKGWNRVLLKIYAMGESAPTRVRLADAAGRPIVPAEVDAGAALHPLGPPATLPALQPEHQVLAVLREAAAASSEPALHGALSALYRLQAVPDHARAEALRALDAAPGEALYRLLAAQAEAEAHHLPDEHRANESRRHYAAAVDAMPDCVPALIGLAERLHRDEQPDAAPDQTAAAELAAGAAGAERRPGAVAEHYARARKADQSRLDLWFAELEALVRIDDADGVRALAEALVKVAPRDADVWGQVARQYLRIGQAERALAAVDRAVALQSENEAHWRLQGDILLQEDEQADALAAYRRSLDLRPAQHDLRRLIGELEGRTYDFWTPHAVDPDDALNRARSRRHAGSTVRVIDQTVMQIHEDGSREESVHQMLLVLTDGGIGEARRIPIYGEVLQARTILPNGQSMEPVRLSNRNAFDMPVLRPGAATEYRYLLGSPERYDRGMHGPAFYFRAPNGTEAFLLSEYIIRVPEGYPFAYVQRNFDTPVHVERKNGMVIYRWSMRNMQPVWDEPNSPHIKEFLPYVEIASQASWTDVARILRNAVLNRDKPTRELETLVRQTVADAQSPRERMERLYRLVLDEVEESGLRGSAATIWMRRSGERDILLCTLLRIAGIRAELAGIRPHPDLMFPAEWELPQAGHFPLRAVRVELPDGEQPVWLDTRYDALAPGAILEEFRGATAFVLDPAGAYFDTLPAPAPETYAATERRRYVLDAEARSARLEGERTLRGTEAMQAKEDLPTLSRRERIRRLEGRLSEALPVVTAEELTVPDLDVPAVPYRETYVVSVERMLTNEGRGRYSVSLGIAPLALVEDLDEEPEDRSNPFRIERWQVRRDTVR